jgi:hypothetical protein
MNVNKKTFFVIPLATLLLLALPCQLFARGLWYYGGTVTRAPWVDTHDRVEIDDKTYTLRLKDSKFERHYRDSSGMWRAERWPISSLRVGEKVIMKAEERRIIELFVEE